MRSLVTVLRFLRFPLVWTAVADVMAGAAVAMAGPAQFRLAYVWPLAIISPALYLLGMAMNDLVDLADDRRAGRDRPLARGQMSVWAALMVLVVLLGLVLMGAAFVNRAAVAMIAATLAAIVVYNGAAKRWTPTALVFMVACRAGNVLIGFAAVAHEWRFNLTPEWPYAWALLGSVAMLTACASLVSALEKRHAMTKVLSVEPSGLVLACLMFLPVADGACVALAWGFSAWALCWLVATLLVPTSAAVIRRLAAATAPGAETPPAQPPAPPRE